MQPTKPALPAVTAKMKSVWGSGRNLRLLCECPEVRSAPEQSAFADSQYGLPGVVTKAAAVGIFRIENYVDTLLLIVFDELCFHADPVSEGQKHHAQDHGGDYVSYLDSRRETGP